MKGFFTCSGPASVGAPSGAIWYGEPLILIAAEAAPTASDATSYLKVVGWVEPAKPNNTNFIMISCKIKHPD